MTKPHTPAGGGAWSAPPPSAVPGWDEARRRGDLPSVPSSIPVPDVTPSARTAMAHLWVTVAAVVIALIVVMLVAGSGGSLGLVGVPVLLATAAVGTVVAWTMTKRWGRAVLAETRHGYTTSPFDLGRFWLRPAPGAPWTVGWVGWDFGGVWVLSSDGSVRPPRPDVLAPGFYPSPRGEGRWELWTGSQWSNWVEDQPPAGL